MIFRSRRQRYPVQYLRVDSLRPHEEVKTKKSAQYTRYADRARTVFAKPILVDRATRVILDGHHRYEVACRLGWQQVPCCLVDYLDDDSIQVESRRPDIAVSKEGVIEMGLSDKKYPHKTTKHRYTLPEMEESVNLKRFAGGRSAKQRNSGRRKQRR